MGIGASAASPRGRPWEMLPRTRLPGRDEVGGHRWDETTGRPRGDVSSMDEAARMTLWRTVTDEATAGRGSVGRRFRRGHRTAAVVIASAKNLWGQL